MSKPEQMTWPSELAVDVDPGMFGRILTAAADVVISIDRRGEVLAVATNPNQRGLGCLDHWVARPLKEFLTEECRRKLDALLAAFASATPDITRIIQLNHVDNATWEFPIDYTAYDTGGAILLIGRDLRPVAEIQQEIVRVQAALERDYEAFRDFDTRYRVVMAAAHDAFVFVDAGSGRIEDANPAAGLMLGADVETLAGSVFVQEFEHRRRAEFLDELNTAAASGASAPIVAESRRLRTPIRIYPTGFRAAGRKTLLCRLDSAASTTPVAEELTANLRDLYAKGLDALVFTDRRGVIASANESFVNLCDASSSEALKGRSLAEFLVRGTVDLKILIDNASRSGRVRTFATRIETVFGSQRPVEMSATYLSDRPDPVVAFVVRDATRPDLAAAAGPPNDVTRSVMHLVGSSPLKDIVAATTDVVEKICIETAVELTRNNRVAAAEMLGLSRQSLYVKLRKYGLLDRSASSARD
jgi:transcriptional regulator PpsR